MRLLPSTGGTRRVTRSLSVLLFALLCATVAYWALQLLAPAVRIAPAGSLAGAEAATSPGLAQALFGRTGAATTEAAPAQAGATDIKVLGVIASTERGAAVISVDGRPAEAIGVGDRIDDTHRLKAVSAREVVVVRNDETELRVPAPEPPDVAILTSGPAPGASPAREAPPPRPLPPAGAAAAAAGDNAGGRVSGALTRAAARRAAPPAGGIDGQPQR